MSGILAGLQGLQFTCIRTVVNTSLYIRRSAYFSPNTQPDRIHTYPCRPQLFPSRIFIPRDTPTSPRHGTPLPLVVCTHGGGFVVNNPAVDDPLARYLADTCRCVVVSIDYRKCPQNRFPSAYEDIVELSLAAINDPELPLDRSKVVLLGRSAGGNLVLAAAQDPRLRRKVMGVLALYPLCDLVPTADEKLSTRPDPSIPDFLGASFDKVRSLYLGDDPRVEDARVSPGRFSAREDLPDRVFLLGCEHDMLCHETEDMANRLARASSKTPHDADGWQAGGVRWHKIKGQLHAFDHFPKTTPDEETLRLAVRDSTYQLISQWLLEGFMDTLSE